ncbi:MULTISPECIES: bacterial transcriptional activator domain-containing protein [Aquitalea]|uniref:bacterial transcriptional activator domain-containing protein n=1 Tax=Aquitalea TaxID=407217 RepID=UPI000F5A84C3|nr:MULTISPECIES: bacterial transcriptional activator domain-containing protein [Aquitalea]
MLQVPRAMAGVCEEVLDGAEADWRAGRVIEVAHRLQQQELQCADRARNNLVLGEALLMAGRPADALLPLERAVTQAPQDKAGWRALAQAWLMLGDDEAVLEALHNSPELPAGKMRSGGLHWGFSVEAVRGYDSNANQATDVTSIIVPALGNIRFQLNPLSRQNGDNYWGNAVHARGEWVLSPTMDVYLSAGYTRRNYDDLHVFSTEDRSMSANGNYSTVMGAWSAGMQYGQLLQAGQQVRRSLTGSLNWQAVRNSPIWPVIGMDIGNYHYIGGPPAMDGFVERVLTISNTFPLGRNSIGWALLAGQDAATVRRADGNRDMVGMRLLASGPLFRNFEWFSWFGRVDSHYHHSNPVFMEKRYDILEDLTVGLNWNIYRGLSIRGQVSASRQRSNIRLFDYRRADSNFSVRYDFGS